VRTKEMCGNAGVKRRDTPSLTVLCLFVTADAGELFPLQEIARDEDVLEDDEDEDAETSAPTPPPPVTSAPEANYQSQTACYAKCLFHAAEATTCGPNSPFLPPASGSKVAQAEGEAREPEAQGRPVRGRALLFQA